MAGKGRALGTRAAIWFLTLNSFSLQRELAFSKRTLLVVLVNRIDSSVNHLKPKTIRFDRIRRSPCRRWASPCQTTYRATMHPAGLQRGTSNYAFMKQQLRQDVRIEYFQCLIFLGTRMFLLLVSAVALPANVWAFFFALRREHERKEREKIEGPSYARKMPRYVKCAVCVSTVVGVTAQADSPGSRGTEKREQDRCSCRAQGSEILSSCPNLDRRSRDAGGRFRSMDLPARLWANEAVTAANFVHLHLTASRWIAAMRQVFDNAFDITARVRRYWRIRNEAIRYRVFGCATGLQSKHRNMQIRLWRFLATLLPVHRHSLCLLKRHSSRNCSSRVRIAILSYLQLGFMWVIRTRSLYITFVQFDGGTNSVIRLDHRIYSSLMFEGSFRILVDDKFRSREQEINRNEITLEPSEYKRTSGIEESMHIFGLFTDAYSKFDGIIYQQLKGLVRTTMMHKLENIVLPVISPMPLSHFVDYTNKRQEKGTHMNY
ncbi:hypothetical protein CLF_111961 [Clonorchis sinensis]|uniref:PI-PLC Y-box domain-containing protein n=1 Tax=Clonorchis sinensis TaxID=79923 RepID=G7YVL3_CLOSI|nr:hypothetical protein CLF_111961 [Clonorchis sinensis]